MNETSRLHKIHHALSQLGNVMTLRRHRDTDASESISGRCFWEARYGSKHWTWVWAERAIDRLFWRDHRDGMGHCELADLADYERAKTKVRRFEARTATNPAPEPTCAGRPHST